MRILYYPQLSMRSYQDNEWLVSKDAQFTKILAYVRALPEDWEWTFVMPAPNQSSADWLFMLPDNVSHVWFDWSDNVLEMRYHFDMPFAKMLLSTYGKDFDVMLCEVPEHVRAWRVAQRYAGKEFPIVAMVEHVDIYEQTRVPELQRFMLRQIDGALASDAIAFPLQGMKDEWFNAAEATMQPSMMDTLNFDVPSPVWKAIYSSYEVLATKPARWIGNSPVINFISRLSDNQRTHYEEFFRATSLMADEGLDFEVWVANPNEAKSEAWVRDACHNVTRVGPWKDRRSYLESLWGSDVVPILYPQDRIYSLGFCEAITARNLVLTHDTEGWPGWQILAPFQPTPEYIASCIGDMISLWPDRERKIDEQIEWLTHDRSVEHNIENVRNTIEEVVERGKVRS